MSCNNSTSSRIGIYLQHSSLITILFALLLISCSTGTTIGKANSAPTRLSTATTVTGKVLHLQQIYMFTVSTGWAVDGTNRILHTTTGVAHWQDVTPAVINSKQYLSIGGGDFFDALTARLVVGSFSTSVPTLVYSTHNGGKSWQRTQLPPGPPLGGFFFLNAKVGWLILDSGAAAGQMALEILRTSDGGTSWKLISISSDKAGPSALPYIGDKTGFSFVNETTGWATGYTHQDKFTWLYVTHDGGATWRHQDLPLPAQASQVTTMPPRFFSATDGLLPVFISSRASETMTLYATHDGGASWHPTSPVPDSPWAFALTNMQHAWIVSDSGDARSYQYIHSTIYSTSDGGWHWAQHIVKFSASTIMIDFVSPTQGWAIDDNQILYQTTDGGQTWAKVMPIIP
jgi:photosystem II stability/assembly factor-like uncharacterized protein